MYIVHRNVLISLLNIQLSSFPNTTYWRDCIFPPLHTLALPCLFFHSRWTYVRGSLSGLSSLFCCPVCFGARNMLLWLLCVCARLCLTLCGPMTMQAPLSVESSRQEHWSGLPSPSPGGLPDADRTHIFCISCIGRQILYRWVTGAVLTHCSFVSSSEVKEPDTSSFVLSSQDCFGSLGSNVVSYGF